MVNLVNTSLVTAKAAALRVSSTIPTEPTTLQVNVIPAITPPGSTLCEGDVVDISASLLNVALAHYYTR